MENADTIRIGKVSSINYPAGTVTVVYEDRDNSETEEIPMQSYEYMMPEVDDMVQVKHLSNGSEMAVVSGRFWNDENRPFEGKKGLWRKELSHEKDKAVARYADDEQGLFSLKVPRGSIETYEDELTIKSEGEISVSAKGELTIESKEGAASLLTQNEITMQSTKGITLTCGESSIHISPDGISISAKTLNFKGSATFEDHVLFSGGTDGDRA